MFDAWGNRVTSGATSDVRAGFASQSGGVNDAETGLVLCGYRYYDPVNGRWLTRDPIGTAGGVNVYAYCGNNGVMRNDPSGLFMEAPTLPTPQQLADAGRMLGAAGTAVVTAPVLLPVIVGVGLVLIGGAVYTAWDEFYTPFDPYVPAPILPPRPPGGYVPRPQPCPNNSKPNPLQPELPFDDPEPGQQTAPTPLPLPKPDPSVEDIVKDLTDCQEQFRHLRDRHYKDFTTAVTRCMKEKGHSGWHD